MFLRAFNVLMIIAMLGLAAPAQMNLNPNLPGERASISGSIRGANAAPVRDARIQLQELNTGRVVASTYSNGQGSFEFINIARGTYEVVATQGLAEVRERVNLASGNGFVSLQLPPADDDSAGGRYAVSVGQLQVPEKARKAFKKANSAMDHQKLDEARKYVDEAISICPGYADALTLRAILGLDANRPEEARADAEKAIQADANDALAYLVLGAADNSLGRYDDALRVLDHGVGLAPNSWQGYFEMGKASLGKANYEAALRQLRKARELAPKEYAPVHLVLAHAFLGLKDYPEAMSELEAYLDRKPAGPDSMEARQTLEKVRTFAANTPK